MLHLAAFAQQGSGEKGFATILPSDLSDLSGRKR